MRRKWEERRWIPIEWLPDSTEQLCEPYCESGVRSWKMEIVDVSDTVRRRGKVYGSLKSLKLNQNLQILRECLSNWRIRKGKKVEVIVDSLMQWHWQLDLLRFLDVNQTPNRSSEEKIPSRNFQYWDWTSRWIVLVEQHVSESADKNSMVSAYHWLVVALNMV